MPAVSLVFLFPIFGIPNLPLPEDLPLNPGRGARQLGAICSGPWLSCSFRVALKFFGETSPRIFGSPGAGYDRWHPPSPICLWGVSLFDVYSGCTVANGRPQSGPTPLVPSAIVLQLPPRGPRWITISNLPGSSPAPPTGVRQPDLRPALPLGVALRVVVSALQHYQRCPGLISEHLHRGTPPGSLGLQSLCCNRRANGRPPIIGPWPV